VTQARRWARGGALALGTIGTWAMLASTASAAVVQSKPSPLSWQTNGRVLAIEYVGTTAYIAGKFTSVRPPGDPAGTGEVTRNHVAAFDTANGTLLPWDPNTNAVVDTLLPAAGGVYLGGSFTTVGGTSRKRLAEVNLTTGAAITAFKASVNAEVQTLAMGNGVMYAGGSFTNLGGSQSYVGAFNPTTGAFVPGWTPTVDAAVRAITLSTDGTRVILGGNFTTLNGVSSWSIGAVNPNTGASRPWAWHGPIGGGTHPFQVVDLITDPATGAIYGAGTGNGGSFMKFDAATGNLTYIGGANGNVDALAVNDGVLYVGGHFTGYCGLIMGNNFCTVVASRDHLLAVDDATGALETWHPAANSSLGVFCAASNGGTQVAFGGDFTRLGGVAQQGFGFFTE
jgi:hypothetical protein